MPNPNGQLTKSQLLKKTIEAMDDDKRVPTGVAKDFVASMQAAIEEALEAGQDVVVFDVVRLKPDFVLAKPKRTGTDPRSGEVKAFDARPATLRLKVAAVKQTKDALPGATTKPAKALKEVTVARVEKAAANKAKREAEAAEPDEAPAKKSTKTADKKSSGKKTSDNKGSKKKGGKK